MMAVLVLGPMTDTIVYGASIGDMLYSKSLDIAEEITLANGVYWNSGLNDKVAENYIQFVPGGSVVPMISYGNDLYGAASFKAVAATAETNGNHVVAGLNGDYFTMSNGVAMGMTIKDGILLTSERTSYPSVGFYADGTAIIGQANLNILLTGATLDAGIGLINLNKVVTTSSGIMLYTTDFGDDDTNKASIPTYNILLNVISGEPRINGAIEATVDSIVESTGAVKIPEGKMMLTIAAASNYPGTLAKVKTLLPGDPLTLSFAASEDWSDVVYAVGGGDKLITAGVNVAPTSGEVDPRTAIGIKADGSMIYYTVDGRQTGVSKGASLSQVAGRLLELGCVEAINMDGGGSTAVHSIYPGDSTLTTINIPSEGSLRSCANYILLVNQATATGVMKRIHLYPYSVQMLAGATQAFLVKATDQNYYPVTPPTSLTYSASSGLGTFNESGLFKAGTITKSGEVTIKANNSMYNSAVVNVVAKPDSITVTNQSDGKAATALSVNAGDILDFSAQAIYKKMGLVAQDDCFAWSAQGDIGTIDSSGRFVAGNVTNGMGTITVSAGGTVATVSIKVVSEGQRLESFENSSHALQQNEIPGLSVRLNQDLTKVRYGYQSAKVHYSFDETGTQMITIGSSLAFPKSPDTLSLWIKGDGSNNTLNLVFQTNTGDKEIIGTTLGDTEWKQVVVKVPEGATALSSIRIFATGKPEGEFYVDQIVDGIGYYVDQAPPILSMNLTGSALSASVKDEIDSGLSSQDIQLTYDGSPMTFQYNMATTALTASLPVADGFPHRVTLVASDESGNLARSSLSIPAGLEMQEPFIDMGSHWAKASTSYLYSRGIINGVTTENGLMYIPDNRITRAEFAVLMSNWLGEDPTLYDDVELPFADAASIPPWALDAAKAMYGMGIIQGIGVEGSLYFKPTSPISREEVMTIIGRTQIRGFGEADLTPFADQGQIASWALPYVKTLVYQGVVNGYDEKLWPKNQVTRAQVATMITTLN